MPAMPFVVVFKEFIFISGLSAHLRHDRHFIGAVWRLGAECDGLPEARCDLRNWPMGQINERHNRVRSDGLQLANPVENLLHSLIRMLQGE